VFTKSRIWIPFGTISVSTRFEVFTAVTVKIVGYDVSEEPVSYIFMMEGNRQAASKVRTSYCFLPLAYS
jgi:hypothetical protein